jgi:hypothetical protein
VGKKAQGSRLKAKDPSSPDGFAAASRGQGTVNRVQMSDDRIEVAGVGFHVSARNELHASDLGPQNMILKPPTSNFQQPGSSIEHPASSTHHRDDGARYGRR